jgi:hypothetical protein
LIKSTQVTAERFSVMLGFLDNGFLIFLIIALLSAVSEWLAKRRAAKGGDDSVPVPPIRPVRPGDGAPPPSGHGEVQSKRKAGSLFEQLEQELRRLTEDRPLVEVLDDEPSRRQGGPVQAEPLIETGVPRISDPVQVHQKKLADIERKKKEAAQKLSEARRKADLTQKHPKKDATPLQFAGFGTNSRQIRQWLRHRKQLRSAIVLNTLLETPKGLKSFHDEQ